MTAGIFSWEGLQSAQSQRTAWFINYCWGAPQSHQQDGDLATKIAEIVTVPVKWKCTMSLTKQQALDFFRSDDLIGLGMEADSLRRKLHPEGVATYIIDRNINYTNF
ncbi:MAG TPA: hypothetical protein VE054_10130 [Blattabacteriaceae bacterium]|nr:hypothetical protein [Blattabacteriaceae bacterium]